MNKRIRELAEQAGYVPLEPRTFADDLQDIFLKKFTELIVRECAGVVQNAVDHREPASTYVDKIKQHFGVEV